MTEKDSFNNENNTAGQYPCLVGLHISNQVRLLSYFALKVKNFFGKFISGDFHFSVLDDIILLPNQLNKAKGAVFYGILREYCVFFFVLTK